MTSATATHAPATSTIASTPAQTAAAPSTVTAAAPRAAPANHKRSHAILDESDSDTSDSDSEDDLVQSNVLLRNSTRVLDIVPAAGAPPKEVEIKNASSWNMFDEPSGGATSTSASPGVNRPITPGSSTTTPGGPETEGYEDAENGAGGLWDSFRVRDAQNKQRDKERHELEERQRKEKEEKERAEARAQEEARKAAEEQAAAALRAQEEEKQRREAEIRAKREAERAQREAASEGPGLNLMEQATLMHAAEKELRKDA